jgi:hypothetical protein
MPRAPYTRQHYLPCAYLKNFSSDGRTATRKSKIWRIASTDCAHVKVETQCAKDLLFSKKEPEKTERQFQQIEGAYGKVVRKIWTGEPLTENDTLTLIVGMLDLHVRNVAHENQTGLEGVEAYHRRAQTLLDRLVIGNTGVEATPESEMFAYLRRYWNVALLRPQAGDLIAGDNPSLCFSWREAVAVHFILMPVTPSVHAVAYDSRLARISGEVLTESDGAFLAISQVRHAVDCVYAAGRPDDREIEVIRREWNSRTPLTSTVDLEKWDLHLLTLPKEDRLSFLRRI